MGGLAACIDDAFTINWAGVQLFSSQSFSYGSAEFPFNELVWKYVVQFPAEDGVKVLYEYCMVFIFAPFNI